MKLKCQPADFVVEEVCRLPLSGGDFALYELAKESLGTLEAVQAIERQWQLPRGALQFAGLKDKHAQTTQTVTIFRGPRRNLRQTRFELRYRGQASRAVEAGDIAANQFRIAVRDLAQAEAAHALQASLSLAQEGIPNYFDDQRFGSLGESGEFIARPWCLGNWERTVWLIIADASEHDSSEEREQKALLRRKWGEWPALLTALPRFRWRSVLTHLANRPQDFRGALAAVRQDLRSLYLAAYQSDLWNGMLAALIAQHIAAEQRQAVSIGRREVQFWTALGQDRRSTFGNATLPLPSARLHEVDATTQRLIDEVLEPEGIALRQLRVKYPRDSFFSKGDRPVAVWPTDFSALAGDDELYPGRQRLSLDFRLPRGSYATVVIKRLFDIV